MDYEQVAAEFLKALRGQRSQVAFSRRLKYKSNIAYFWESGRSWPTAAKALYACHRVGIDPSESIAKFYRIPPPWLGLAEIQTPGGVARMLNDLRGETAMVEISKRTGRSRFAVSRWLKGESEPRLPDFFRLLDAISARLLEFISCFVDPLALPSLRASWRRLQAATTMIAEMPWSPAVLLCLETVAYAKLPKHVEGWLASRLGLALEDEVRCLEVLRTTGQIHWEDNLWKVAQVQTIDTRAIPSYGRTLKAWWSQAGLRRIQEEGPGLFSFNVFSISNHDYGKLCDMQRAYFREVRGLIANSAPAERVAALNLHLFPLEIEE